MHYKYPRPATALRQRLIARIGDIALVIGFVALIGITGRMDFDDANGQAHESHSQSCAA